MIKKLRVPHILFFIFLLVLPLQVFGHGEEDDGHDVDDAPWFTEKGHGHGEEDDHSHGDHDHGEGDDHGHGESDDHGHGEGDDHGHGESDDPGHGEGDDHGHGESDDPGHGEGDDHGHGEDDHDHEYVETGANLPLLGTFAAINGGFIMLGAVRKFTKKRKSGAK